MGLYEIERGASPFASTGLTHIQGNADEQQKPDILVYYDGSTTDVPTLVCPGHLKLAPAFNGLLPIEIPFFDIERVTTVEGSFAATKKKIRVRCNIQACQDNAVFGVTIQRIPDPRFPVVYEKMYFDSEVSIDPDCVTDCSTRAYLIRDKINADPNSIVVATVETTSSGASGSGSGSGSGTTVNYWLVLEDKSTNADFRAQPEGFDSYTVDVNYSTISYTAGMLRQAYGARFATGKADSTVFRATEIVYRKLTVIGNSGGSSSTASINENYEVQKKLCVVITDAALTNSVNAKTELDAITNGTKSTALYLDKQC